MNAVLFGAIILSVGAGFTMWRLLRWAGKTPSDDLFSMVRNAFLTMGTTGAIFGGMCSRFPQSMPDAVTFSVWFFGTMLAICVLMAAVIFREWHRNGFDSDNTNIG